MQVAIIGGGAIGQAIKSCLANDAARTVLIYDKRDVACDFSATVSGADIIFLCIPSAAIREVLERCQTIAKPEVVVISLAKGVEKSTGKFMHEVIGEYVPSQFFGLLSGPMLAEELGAHQGGVGVVASADQSVYRAAGSVLQPDYLRLEYSDDVGGVALAGVLKNVYALAVGISAGLGFRQNMQGWLAAQAIRESITIASAVKHNPEIILGTAGLADFIATAFSPYSLNREAGQTIVQGGVIPKSEGYTSLAKILTLTDGVTNELPLLAALESVVIQQEAAAKVFHDLCYGEAV